MDYCHSTVGHDIFMTNIGQTGKILERLFLSDKSPSDEKKLLLKVFSLNPDKERVFHLFLFALLWSGVELGVVAN